MPDQDGYLNLPSIIRREIWNITRPYRDVRLYLRDAPFIPGWVKPFIKGSARVGAVVDWIAGPDGRA